MVNCSKCQTPNSLDSKFCKLCGAPIAEDDLNAALSEQEALVAEGYRIFSEGRTDEARLVAETVLASDPPSTSALSLKGMCHERGGEIAEALDCFERVVALNPDSPLDKIKVTHLRNTLASRIGEEPAPDRRRALFAAIAATALVVSVGVAISGLVNRNQAESASKGDAPGAGVVAPYTPIQQGGATGPGTQNVPVGAGQPNASQGTAQPNATGIPPAGAANPGVAPGGAPSAPINPNPNIGRLPAPGSAPWVPPGIPENVSIDPTNRNPNPGTNGAAPPPSQPPGVDPNEGPDPKIGGPTKEPAGVIDIRVSRPNPASGGGVSVPDSGSGDALARAGRQRQLAGRYPEAIKLYEQALRAGSDPGSTNQRLGQCFANLGRLGESAVAYQRAVTAYEAQLQSGGGDRARLEAALDACRQALKVVKGGT